MKPLVLVTVFLSVLLSAAAQAERTTTDQNLATTFVCWVYDGDGISYPSDSEQQCYPSTALAKKASMKSCEKQSADPNSCRVVTCNRCGEN